jgi:hypothetical protein
MACCFHIEIDGEEHGYQFASETAFTTLDDGTTWCCFHLPILDERGNASPKAGWDETDIGKFNQTVFAIIDAANDAGEEDDQRAD